MPLIIAVLIILVTIVSTRESKKKNVQQSAVHEKDRRKTNAKLEQRTLDNYMKHGYSFNDAFQKTYEDMISAGYEPCIPRKAYKNRGGIESSSCGIYGGDDVERYDSFWVSQRRKDAERQWQKSHPGVHINNAPTEELDALIYSDFPSTERQYLRDIERSIARASSVPIGDFVIYPGLGTCEVLEHNWIGDGTAGGTYTLRVLKTGQIVKYVKIGDKKIRRQGQ